MQEKYEIVRDMLHRFDYSAFFTGTPNGRLAVLPGAMEHILKQENGKDRFLKGVADLSKAFGLAVRTKTPWPCVITSPSSRA